MSRPKSTNWISNVHHRSTNVVIQEMQQTAENLAISSGDKERLLSAMEGLLRALRACEFSERTDRNLLQVIQIEIL